METPNPLTSPTAQPQASQGQAGPLSISLMGFPSSTTSGPHAPADTRPQTHPMHMQVTPPHFHLLPRAQSPQAVLPTAQAEQAVSLAGHAAYPPQTGHTGCGLHPEQAQAGHPYLLLSPQAFPQHPTLPPQRPILLVAPGSLLSSREKVSVLTKKVLLYLYFRNKTVFDLKKLLPVLGGELKKVLEVVFILEGVGWLMRLNKTLFVFTGFEGMINKFHEYVAHKKAEVVAKEAAAKEPKEGKEAKDGKAAKPVEEGAKAAEPVAEVDPKGNQEKGDDEAPEEKKNAFRIFYKYENMQIMDKQIQVLPYELLADLAGTIVFELLLSVSKVYSKKIIEDKFDKMVSEIKDGNFKPNLHDFQKILEAIGLVDTTENNTNALWVGPDCINITGITMANVKTIRNIEDVVIDHYRQYKAQFPTETSQREASFFLSLHHVLTTVETKGAATDRLLRSADPEAFQEHPKIPRFDKIGFCALKNKNFSYIVTKPSVIIGASKKARGEEHFSWVLDIDLFPDPYVSKQHALLMFNFQSEKWEIRCLSPTNPIKVKDRILTERDEARSLDENCFIRIGKQTIWFSLQQEEEANNEDLEEA